MGIGELAKLGGVSVPTIRFYEEVGLLPFPFRKANGHRTYGADTVKWLTFIRRCRSFGFSLPEIRELATVMKSDERSCFEARDLAEEHLARVQKSLLELRALETDLRKFTSECRSRCTGGPGRDCAVLGELHRTALANSAETHSEHPHASKTI